MGKEQAEHIATRAEMGGVMGKRELGNNVIVTVIRRRAFDIMANLREIDQQGRVREEILQPLRVRSNRLAEGKREAVPIAELRRAALESNLGNAGRVASI